MITQGMATPLRVLAIGSVYPPHHLGGYEVIWSGVMRQLELEGHTVRVLTTGYRRPGVAPDTAEDGDVRRELQWYWEDHTWRSLGLEARLALERHNRDVLHRQLADLRPDVVAWWPLGGMSLSLVEQVRRAGLPSVFFMLDNWIGYGRKHDLWMRAWSRFPPAAPLVARLTGIPTTVRWPSAGRWIFCSATLQEQVRAEGVGIDAGIVLTPGVARMFLEAEPETAPRKWSWSLLYIGRVVEQKGVDTAIESLPQLPSSATLRIVGDGDPSYRAELERLAEALEVRDRVRFESTRPRAELIGIYRSADAVVFPVRWLEPWGLVPLEAMAVGRPVVATGRGGSGDYLIDGVNSLLFKPGAARELAEALGRLAAGGRRTAQEHGEDPFSRAAAGQIVAAGTGGRTHSQDDRA
jgi:glycosyltransferase involved in cell wall biosynthesis